MGKSTIIRAMRIKAAKLLVVMALVVSPLAWGCSGGGLGEYSGDAENGAGGPSVFEEGTLSSASVEKTTRSAGAPEGTIGAQPDVTLRVEGDRGTRFSGICTVGGENSATDVLAGRVPKRYLYELRGETLSCRIQKQDSGGSLRIILLAGDATRSVQQTNARDGVIGVSFGGT